MATLQKYRGAYALVGPTVDALARDALRGNSSLPIHPELIYHITVITKAESKTLSAQQVESALIDTHQLFAVGVGGKPNDGVYWVVIIWAAGQQLRKRLGLPPKHFHITLSTADIHDVDKGVASLLPGQPPVQPSVEFLDHTAFTLHCFGQHYEAQEYSARLVALSPDSYKGFLRLADASFADGHHKVAMLAYACAYERSTEEKLTAYCSKKLVECSHYTEWGSVMQEHDLPLLERFDTTVRTLLLRPWSPSLKEHISDLEHNPSLPLSSRQPLYIPSSHSNITEKDPFYKLPRFFRWLVPYHLAIMSTPRNIDDIAALASPHLGIRHVLTLTEEEPLPRAWFKKTRPSIANTFLPVRNYHPPSMEQMDLIVRLFEDARNVPLLVHCGGGKGRAGSVAACYLAAYGFCRPPAAPQRQPVMGAGEAIARLRALRPGSLETKHQEEFVAQWCSAIWKRRAVVLDLVPEPAPSPVAVEGKVVPEKHDLVMLVGLPGAGKSWVAQALMARSPKGWVYISQDDTGSRSACETAVGRKPGRGQRVILDRCNTAKEDRKQWLALVGNWCTSPVCILFDYDPALCVSRAQNRAGHPTLPPGSRVRNAVTQMNEVFQKPTLDDGFDAVITVKSFAAAHEAVVLLSGGPPGILKFPRTPHLLDLGAASEDDVHVDLDVFARVGPREAANAVPTIVITEKVDGANMGFSLSSSSTPSGEKRILIQNRSHYINPSTHEQFKKLGGWVSAHERELLRVLDRDPLFAERYVLYGEWLAATHSIPYTRLPDRFLAFDLYDRAEGRWMGRRMLEALLRGDTDQDAELEDEQQREEVRRIQIVPVIYEGSEMPTQETLLGMIQSPSAFYEGRVEGVYVKVEVDGWVKARGKVVRSDFIAGNEHWTKGNLRLNTLAVDVRA